MHMTHFISKSIKNVIKRINFINMKTQDDYIEINK